MPSEVTPIAPVQAEEEIPADLRIEVSGRWDAVALLELLVPFHSFLVEHTSDRWAVHARVPGSRGEPLAEALRVIGEWRAERPAETPVRVEVRRGPWCAAGADHSTSRAPEVAAERVWTSA